MSVADILWSLNFVIAILARITFDMAHNWDEGYNVKTLMNCKSLESNTDN